MFRRKPKSSVLSGELYPQGLPEGFLPPIPAIEANTGKDVASESHYGLARYMKQANADSEGWKVRHFLVVVEPEPSNQYDSHAIKVGVVSDYDPEQRVVMVEQVGYVPATQTGTWHKWLGQQDAARVTTWGRGNGKKGRFGLKVDGRKGSLRYLGSDVRVAWHL